ncbi:MAG: DMT family transporter, partial [Candidatus Dadabacteria bacterium]|nr:DMT family transporter [Candidatus Dadabacteria bacterium]
DVAVITETKPIWVALLAGYLLGEAAGKRIWVSIIMGMTGVVLVEHTHIGNGSLAGLAALYGALAGAVVMIILRKLRGLDPRVIVTHFAGTASLTCLVLIFDLSFLSETKNLLMLAGVGLFGTVGQLAMTKAFAMGEAPGVSAAGFIKVGFSAGYDLLIFRYAIELATLLGITLILGSTAWLIKPPARKAIEEVKEEARGMETG